MVFAGELWRRIAAFGHCAFLLCAAGGIDAGCEGDLVPLGVAGQAGADASAAGGTRTGDSSAELGLAAPDTRAGSDGDDGSEAEGPRSSDAGLSDQSAEPDGRGERAEVDATGGDGAEDAAPALDDQAAADVTGNLWTDADAAASLAKSCVEICEHDEDCSSTQASGAYHCDLDGHRCVLCSNDLTCAAIASQWLLLPCLVRDDCGIFGDVCIDINGAGQCAFTFGAADCLGFSDSLTVTEFGTSATVAVCGVASNKCTDGSCVGPCGPESCTPEQGGDLCNATTGRCECGGDADCAGGIGVSRCNPAARQCECAGDADCALVDNGDVCVGGKCGCSGTGVCTHRQFAGTTLDCE